MPLHAQKKGKRGEVEFCEWLDEKFGIKTERNYNQANGCSADILIKDFIIEVKRREILSFDEWWHQVIIAHKNHEDENLIPIVAFRQNRKPWQFLIPAKLIHGIDRGYVIATEKVFIQLMETVI